MEGIREYLLSVTGAAILYAVLRSICGTGVSGNILKLLCGVFLIFTVISPITQIRISQILLYGENIRVQAEDITQQGIDYGRQARERLIKESLEAYILDKADAYGVTLQVEVTLNSEDPPGPERITITGPVSPYVRQQLQSMLETDLQIPKEKQIWKQ